MKLDVLKSDAAEGPWFSGGLKFTCSQCGNCCTGGPGFVWISKIEIQRLAEYLKITAEQVVEKYCRTISGRLSLRESRNPKDGGYDCVFLKQEGSRRSCTVYPVRPLQCRTWPFWESNLQTEKAWKQAGRKCPGMDHGKVFQREQIESLRDAEDWPRNAPTSDDSQSAH
jgi:Fe-S-cluster containining protein